MSNFKELEDEVKNQYNKTVGRDKNIGTFIIFIAVTALLFGLYNLSEYYTLTDDILIKKAFILGLPSTFLGLLSMIFYALFKFTRGCIASYKLKKLVKKLEINISTLNVLKLSNNEIEYLGRSIIF